MVTLTGVPMSTRFQLIGLDPAPFEALFKLPDEALEAHLARRCVARERPGFPCRVSLEDAQVGEELLLLPYRHQSADSPYRASGPIFVRRGARQCRLPVGEVPPYVTSRLMSVRAYDASHLMLAASVCEGRAAAAEIEACFGNEEVAYIHLHNAKQGCFSCQVIRA